jgi:hypothetical protein
MDLSGGNCALEHAGEDVLDGFQFAMDFGVAFLRDVLMEVASDALHVGPELLELSQGETFELGLKRTALLNLAFHRAAEHLHLDDDDLGEEILLVTKMVIDRGLAKTGRVGDVLHRDIGEPALEEKSAGMTQDAVAAVTRGIHQIVVRPPDRCMAALTLAERDLTGTAVRATLSTDRTVG